MMRIRDEKAEKSFCCLVCKKRKPKGSRMAKFAATECGEDYSRPSKICSSCQDRQDRQI